MSTRTITGNLAIDPEVVRAASISITKLRVIENTGGIPAWRICPARGPTTHFVEARFELGENAAASLRTGDAVIVLGSEHTWVWGNETDKRYGRVIDADGIDVDLNRATAVPARTARAERLA